MAENGGLLSVTTKDAVELTPPDCKCLFDSIDRTSNTVSDMKELCCASASQKELDGQTTGCNGQESCENCYTDSGISNSADMDVCSMDILDDSEANGEDYTVDEENQTILGTRQEIVNASTHKDTGIINIVPNSMCSESKKNGNGTAETVLSDDAFDGTCTVYDGNCNIDTSAECGHDIDECDTNSDNVLPACAVDSVQSNQHSVKSIGDDTMLDIKVDDNTGAGHSGGSEVSESRADEYVESCPNSAAVMSVDVENFPADKSLNEGSAAETSEITVFTSAASCQSQSQPTFTSSRSVPRPSRQSRPRMGSYGSPPPSATPSSSCPDDETSKQQYVVNVHVNPGETFSVCVSDQVQLIQGNAFAYLVIHVNFRLCR